MHIYIVGNFNVPVNILSNSCRVKLFGDDNYGGLKLIVTEATKDLETSGFNDKASSAWVIGPCAWIFYEDEYDGNHCILTTGKYPTTDFWGQTENSLTSLRPIPKSGTNAIVLYENRYAGRELVLTKSDDNLDDDEFGDTTTTVIVTGGYLNNIARFVPTITLLQHTA